MPRRPCGRRRPCRCCPRRCGGGGGCGTALGIFAFIVAVSSSSFVSLGVSALSSFLWTRPRLCVSPTASCRRTTRQRRRIETTTTTRRQLFLSQYSKKKDLWVLRHTNDNPNDDKDENDDDEAREDSATTATVYFAPNRDDTRHFHKENSSSSAGSSSNEYSFFDEAVIYVRAGSGGAGATTFQVAKRSKQEGPPDGGNGGNGGDVWIQVDPSLNTLATFSSSTKSFRAPHGQDGGRLFRNGKFGKSLEVRVPPGTRVEEWHAATEQWKDTQVMVTREHNPRVLIAKGGMGGEGNGILNPTRGGLGRGISRPRHSPQGGERKRLRLILEIVADVAIVGVPNAGKSTFLAAVTRAKPKIANYPFTTVIPNLGVWIPPESRLESPEGQQDSRAWHGAGSTGLVLCDVPGLIAGAAQGAGLGHAFLRHIERCHVILHLVDGTSNDPLGDFEMLNREIVKYSPALAQMPQVVVVNKVDVFSRSREVWEEGLQPRWTPEELQTALQDAMTHSRLLWMSAKQHDGVHQVMTRLAGFVQKVKQAKQQQEEED